MLVTAGLNDPRVGYWEPAKWVARLRASKTDDHLLVLRTNMGAGHGGASGRYDALHEQAIRYAFILDQLGLSSATVP
jgi:oligopeptidase B